jgi:arylsulfatase A-like enzyme
MPRLAILVLLLASRVLSSNAVSADREADPKPDRPNILFIAIDDQNDWIGCLGGHPQVKTPNIDKLAAKGTLFTNAHCQSPLCNPSRTSLMTGLRPSTTGIYGLAPWIRNVPALKDTVTLPQYLKKHGGYRNYTTGKIYHGGNGRRKTDREFDIIGPAAGVGVKPPKKLVETPAPHPLVDWGVFPHKDEDKGDWKVASWAVEQLEGMGQEKLKEPFFLSVGFFLPHVPCYATQKWFDLYPEESLILPPLHRMDRDDTPRFSWYIHWKLPEPRFKFLQEAGEWKNIVRSYMACTSFVDSQVGRVLTALEKSGHEDDTIIVLWSDHGFHLGEKLITGKNTLWDRSARVPLMFTGPGVEKGVCSKPAELLDIYPTLIDLCGLPKNEKLEGHSLLPQLKDAGADRPWPAITTHNHDNHGIRSENWRYIRYADGSEELYDMRNDPNEWTNLIGNAKHAKVAAEHHKWLPKINRQPAPGSQHRILIYKDGKANWQGEDIGADEPIPEI